ncbi:MULTISPECIES: hypothetical protein [unclassified Arsenophonus]|uniref:hypothetical protein n=1 Tax=unclassified Arsenophonus TaxID=2627083 RepID=UPI00285E9E30|nr:hypothetical protein [Arsenophonus sp.]MDR5608996.1 hypothetical protein [Arsenophonus sp.]MDR5613383.1 hypothetical protein [Arsenophonus sp.]
MKTLSKVLLVTVLFSFTIFNSSAEANSNNYRSSYIGGGGHGGGHPAAHAPAHNTGHGEHNHREQHEHAGLSSPDPSFYSQFNNAITPCHDDQYNLSHSNCEDN